MYFSRVFLMGFYFFVESYECILLPPNVIFALIEELSISNPTILYNYVTVNHLSKTKLFKEFANNGKTISYQVTGNQGMYKNRVKNDRKKFEIPALLSCE